MPPTQQEPLYAHDVVRARIHDQLGDATELGARKIPIEMTWPLALLKRALREAAEAIDDALQMQLDAHTVGTWVERERKDGEPPKPKKFVPAPVYATNEDGSPKFKLDGKGQPLEEREVAHGKVQLINGVEHGREKREFLRETVRLEVPHLSWKALAAKVPSLEPNVVESLMEYFEDVPTTKAAPAKAPAKPAAAAKVDAGTAKDKAGKAPAKSAAAGVGA